MILTKSKQIINTKKNYHHRWKTLKIVDAFKDREEISLNKNFSITPLRINTKELSSQGGKY